MDKIILHEGGYPFRLDDLEFLYSSFRPLLSLFSSWGDCILGGCYITPSSKGNVTWGAGYISFGGHIYRVEAGEIPQYDQSDTLYWVFSSSEARPVDYLDGSQHASRMVYTGRLIATREAPDGDYLQADKVFRIGVDIARRPRKGYAYSGDTFDVVGWDELSAYSAMVTLRFRPGQNLKLGTPIGRLDIDGVGASYAYGYVVRKSGGIIVELKNGQVSITRLGQGETTGRSGYEEISGDDQVTMLVTWDYIPLSGEPSSHDRGSESQGGYGRGGASRSSGRGRRSRS